MVCDRSFSPIFGWKHVVCKGSSLSIFWGSILRFHVDFGEGVTGHQYEWFDHGTLKKMSFS